MLCIRPHQPSHIEQQAAWNIPWIAAFVEWSPVDSREAA